MVASNSNSTSGSIDETLATIGSGEAGGTRPTRPARALTPGEVVGRHVILARLGAGGMGVVYAAYDPELDRKVAIKLLRSGLDGGVAHEARARLLREAQALAKFSHPEIVAVYDVGVHETGVWIAMEFIEGRTLGAWAKQAPRTWKEIVAIMRAAGRGVAAAHAAGWVHRDLKPDNIMIGDDGRVRVMDFGLTRPQDELAGAGASVSIGELPAEPNAGTLTRQGSLVGTPAYMAPEQFRGAEVTSASDQFAFCVTFWALLFGERPFAGSSLGEIAAAVLDGAIRPPPRDRQVPSWLRRICERGLASDPKARWPSMQALLDELERGEARGRKRGLALGVLVVAGLAAGAAGWQRFEHARAVAACEDAGASLDVIWNDGARDRVRDGLLATRLGYAAATADAVIPYLDAQARAWRDHRTQACLRAEVEARWDARMLDQALWCLDERRLELESLIAFFTSETVLIGEPAQADAEIVRTAVTVASSLPAIDPCLDERTLVNHPDPPDEASRAEITTLRAELARARTLLLAGKYAEGLELVRPARIRAEQLGWPSLYAAAKQREGVLLQQLGEFAAAEAVSVEAYVEAASAGAWALAAEAAIDLIENIGERQARYAEGRVWASHARVAIHHAGDPLGLRAASLATNLGHLELGAGRYDEAEALYERALTTWTNLLGSDHPTIGAHLSNLGNLYRFRMQPAKARDYFERSLALREQVLGPDHPDIAGTLNNIATMEDDLGERERALELLERSLEILERTVGPDHFNTAITLTSLGNIAYRSADYAAAEPYYARALAIAERTLGPEHPDIASLVNNLANVAHSLGELEQAKQLHARALAIREKAVGADHPAIAVSLFNLAMLHATLREYEQAKPLLEQALVINEATYGADHPEIAWTLAEIANAEIELGRPAAALPLLERALSIFDAHEGEQGGEATARFALARALVATGGDRERARAEAERAREGFAGHGVVGAEGVAKVERWLDALR